MCTRVELCPAEVQTYLLGGKKSSTSTNAYTFLCLTSCSLAQVVKIDRSCAFYRRMESVFWPTTQPNPPNRWRCKASEPYIYTIDDFLSENELSYFDTKVVTDADAFQHSLVGGDKNPSDGLWKDQRSSSSLGFTTNQDSTIKRLTNKLAEFMTCHQRGISARPPYHP
jgi:hypothetical protein